MKKDFKQILAEARKQVVANDEGSILDKVATEVAELMEEQQSGFQKAIRDMEDRLSAKLSDQVVDGQKKLLDESVRKGGWQTLENAEVYRRLIDPAGLTMEQKLTMPMDQLKKYLPADSVDKVRIFQELNDDCMILGWIAAVKEAKAGSSFGQIDVQKYAGKTRSWEALQSVHKALTTSGANTGADWIPTQFSSQLIDLITVSLKVAANFTRITIPQNTFKIPVATTDDVAFLVTETTSDNLLDDANVYPRFTPGTDNQTLQAKKLAAIIVFSEEAQEDSIIPLLPFIKMKIANAMANAQERATLDGDVTGTHQDFDVTAATDARKAWPGLRFKTLVATATTKDLSTFNLDNIRGMRELLSAQFAENPEQLFYVSSVKVMLKLLKFPEFLTIDKYGDRATIVTGEVGRIDGSPLQTSKYSRDNVSATGVNTNAGPNTKSLLYLQNRLGFWYGDRRAVTMDSARMVISGQGYVVVTQRVDFKDIYKVASGVNRHGALGYNI
jgi:HK97 family phage major capsid protein